VATAVLIRHARSSANAKHVLAGREPGVGLDDVGRQQAVELAQRLAEINLVAVVSSPLDRCLATAEPILANHPHLTLVTDERLAECDYGEWTGQELKALAKTPLWKAVQAHPSGVTFPGGETMRAMQQRAVDAVRSHDAATDTGHGTGAVWAAISHADVIKSVVADALGLHLDQFQRIVIDAASVTVIRYTPTRPFVVSLNDIGSLASLRTERGRRRRVRSKDSDAVVGGPTG
jgi:probable phosphomutase (TIGR03848 family)